mgnify:CR=1 FL=1
MLHQSLRLSQAKSGMSQGIYAIEPIHKGSIVWAPEENAQILSWTAICNLPKSQKESFLKYGFQCGDDQFSNPCDISRHINHSCNPNCGWNPYFRLVAIKDILASEQATYDYSSNDFDIPFRFECNCQELNCRLIISNRDHLLEGIRFYYVDEPPAYIKSRRASINSNSS